MGVSVTFMAKPFTDATGSGCHLHLSMTLPNGDNAFVGDEELGPIRCSPLFSSFLAGWLRYTPDCMVFYAPTINSYKRFVSASWAPTRLSWSYDNRTAGFRVVGKGKSLRIECRIPGADCNIYLAFAASLASGLKGVKEKLQPPPIFEGNIYEAKQLQEVPKTLQDALNIFEHSHFAKGQRRQPALQYPADAAALLPLTAVPLCRLRAAAAGAAAEAFGEDVVEHYAAFYRNEIEAFNKHVTDWERQRYFERI